MKLSRVPNVGCVLLLLFNFASLQPLESRNLADLNEDSYSTHPKSNLFQRTHLRKKKHAYTRISALPSGYTDFTGCDGKNGKISAYKFHRTKETWSEAKLSCFYEGGYLAYPECSAEDRKYHDILQSVNGGAAWIGLHDMYEEGVWLTVMDRDAHELEYFNWADSEPNNHGPDGENCAELGGDGRWHDKSCDKKRFYFCKIDI